MLTDEEIKFIRIKSILSDCICKTAVFLKQHIPDECINMLCNEYTDKILKECEKDSKNA